MRSKRMLLLLGMMLAVGSMTSACSRYKQEEVVEVTPTPEPTPTPEATPTPTISPDAQTTTYTSANKAVSIELPDATWSNRIDQEDMLSFQSPDAGDILILHGKGEEDMSVAVFPNTEDMAITLEQASELEPGTDFEIMNYSSTDVNGVGVYSYTVHMLHPEKSEGCVYVVHKIFAGSDEYYNLTGSVKQESALAAIQDSINTFKVRGKSSLKAAVKSGGNGGNGEAASSGSSDLTSPSSDEISQEAMSDTNLSRTIYRNSDGHPLVIQPDGNGNWVDNQGNVYEFYTDEDVYDQNGVDYYYHGEAADVYYMPMPEE